MALTFYTNPMSRGRIVRWMLEEVGEPYETVLVDWQDKPAALLAANPLGKVPTIDHNGQIVSEAAAVCAYLAEAFPHAGLGPSAAERARYLRWMFFTAGPLVKQLRARGIKAPVIGQEGYDSDKFIEIAQTPRGRVSNQGPVAPESEDFSGFVFKLQVRPRAALCRATLRHPALRRAALRHPAPPCAAA